jgi:hypothetical protein
MADTREKDQSKSKFLYLRGAAKARQGNDIRRRQLTKQSD